MTTRRTAIRSLPALAAFIRASTATPGATPASGTPTAEAPPGLAPGVPVSMNIANENATSDRLIRATCPIAVRVELRASEGFGQHRHEIILPDGIAVPARGSIVLEPLGDHLALVGLRAPLAQVDTFALDLEFERAGAIAVTGRVRRKQDAAGVAPIPPAVAGGLTISLVSAPPAPGPHPTPSAATPVAPSS